MTENTTEKTRRRYDRLAPVYDLVERVAEHRVMREGRRRLWSLVEGTRILEVGVGTGRNIPFYPPGSDVVAIDLSPAMLAWAQRGAQQLGSRVDLRLMDVEQLDFRAQSFDAVVTSCVFCSVPHPVAGFEEIRRVLRTGGHAYCLEHVLSQRAILRPVMRAANPFVVRMMGANIDRNTRENLENAGFAIESETDLWIDVVKLFVVRAADS